MKKFFLTDNPVFSLLLGLCSLLAVTTTFERGYMMGISLFIVLILSNTIVAIIKRFIPDNVRIPCYIMIVTTLVTALEIILKVYVTPLHEAIGVYLPLIAVNCLILGRALAVASKESLRVSIFDALKVGINYLFVISFFSLIREVIGTNTLTVMKDISGLTGFVAQYKDILPAGNFYPITFFVSPAGAFLILAFLLIIFNILKERKNKI